MSEPEIVYSPEVAMAMARLGGKKDWNRDCSSCGGRVPSCKGGRWRIECPKCGYKERQDKDRPITAHHETPYADRSGCRKQHPMEKLLPPRAWSADRDDQ